MRGLLASVWVLLFVVGCSSKPTAEPTAAPGPVAPKVDVPAPPAPTPAPAPSPPKTDPDLAAWTTCTADADCKAVEMGCCDQCNGGWVLSVNVSSAARAIAHYKGQQGCGGGCTERACKHDTAFCKAGTCALRSFRVVDGKDTWVDRDNKPFAPKP